MAYHVFGGCVPDLDDHLFLSGRFSYSLPGSEMRVRAALLVFAFFMAATPVFIQGCAMFRGFAAATSKDGPKAISNGGLGLVLAPAGFMTLGVVLAVPFGRQLGV